MPVNNNKTPVTPKAEGLNGEKGCCQRKWGCCGGNEFVRKIMLTLAGVLLVYLIFFLGTLVRNNIKKFDYIGKADRMERVITVNGFGKVTGDNDIAVTTIGYANTDKDVGKAQLENNKVMDKVTADLKKLGISEQDLTSNYSIYPDFNYTQDKGQELKGYRVSRQVTVKIRDLGKITEVLNLAGKYGATEVSGLTFTIDDPENLKAQARDKALSDAKAKAKVLAETLGVKVVSVVSYFENEGNSDYYPVKTMTGAEGGGLGGYAPADISAGSRDVVMNVSVTYEIVPAYSYKRW